MISTRVQEAINAQVNAEFWSAYLYLSMSADFAAKGKPGFANWMKIQFKEEQDHANIFMDYLIKRGGVVELKPIGVSQCNFTSSIGFSSTTPPRMI